MYIYIYMYVCVYVYGGFLKWGTPKSSILMGCSIKHHPFGGTHGYPYLWKLPYICIWIEFVQSNLQCFKIRGLFHFNTMVASATAPAQQPKSDAKSLIKAVTTWLRAKFGEDSRMT